MDNPTLLKHLMTYHTSTSSQLLTLLHLCHKHLSVSTKPLVFAFLSNLVRFRPQVLIPYQHSFTQIISYLISKLKYFDSSITLSTSDFKIQNKKSIAKEFDIYNSMKRMLTECLVKSSFQEIVNVLKIYYNDKRMHYFNVYDDVLRNLEGEGFKALILLIECDKIEQIREETTEGNELRGDDLIDGGIGIDVSLVNDTMINQAHINDALSSKTDNNGKEVVNGIFVSKELNINNGASNHNKTDIHNGSSIDYRRDCNSMLCHGEADQIMNIKTNVNLCKKQLNGSNNKDLSLIAPEREINQQSFNKKEETIIKNEILGVENDKIYISEDLQSNKQASTVFNEEFTNDNIFKENQLKNDNEEDSSIGTFDIQIISGNRTDDFVDDIPAKVIKEPCNIYKDVTYTYDVKIVKKILDYFTRHKIDCTTFFYVLFICNKPLYDFFHDYILNELQRHEIITCLPSIRTLDKVPEQTLMYMVEYRAVMHPQIIEYLSDRRDLFITLLKDHYKAFFSPNMTLTADEDLVICESVDEHAEFSFTKLDNDEESILRFTRMLSGKDDSFLVKFFKKFYNKAGKKYETCILMFLKVRKLKEELQRFFIEYFIDLINNESDSSIYLVNESSDNVKRVKRGDIDAKDSGLVMPINRFSDSFKKEVFFSLIIYFDRKTSIKYLEKYLEDEETLREFLRTLPPNDIYFKIHHFTDIQKTLAISRIINTKREVFDDQVSMHVINKLEHEFLPPTFMRTVILSLTNFPKLKKFVSDLMFRLIKKRVWENERLFNGVIKCLEMLESNACEIVMTMPEEVMKKAMDKSNKLLNLCEQFVKSRKGLKGRCAYSLKNVVYGMIRNKQK